MNDNDIRLEQQRDRLEDVFSYLRTMGITRKEIADRVSHSYSDNSKSIDEATLSSYKNGKIKYIPTEFLEALHSCFKINPDYIRVKSDSMLDVLGEQYTHFEAFAKSWRAEEHLAVDPSGNNYTVKELFLKIDKNFIDFLFEVYKTRVLDDFGIGFAQDEIENLKKVFLSSPDIHEYVLTPVKTHFKVIEDRKNASEMLNNLLNYLQSESE